jgi:TPR repeat protein
LADNGDPKGTFMLGYYNKNGISIEKNENKAFTHYQISAELNNPYGRQFKRIPEARRVI